MLRKKGFYFGFGNFYFLLITLLLFFLSYPLLFEIRFGRIISEVFFSAIFFASIYALGEKKKFLIAAIIITIIAVGLKWFVHFNRYQFMVVASDMANILCFAFIAVAILYHILKESDISVNEICGAICGYLLIGFSWGFAYSLIDSLGPNAFNIPGPALTPFHKLPHFIYFSFITLTSTGFGDIHPVSLIAESFSSVEAITGQIYLIVLIGWLVAGHVHRKARANAKNNPNK